MKIREINSEEKLNYPKQKNINNNKLKKSIPNKWMKYGITMMIFGMIMKSKSLSFEQELAGDVGFPMKEEIPLIERMMPYIELGAISLLAISVLGFIVTKIKLVKDKKNKKVRKLKNVFLILAIISVIALVVSYILYNI